MPLTRVINYVFLHLGLCNVHETIVKRRISGGNLLYIRALYRGFVPCFKMIVKMGRS